MRSFFVLLQEYVEGAFLLKPAHDNVAQLLEDQMNDGHRQVLQELSPVQEDAFIDDMQQAHETFNLKSQMIASF